MNPKLTVIICTYNRGHLLTETIPTILQQNVSKDLYNVLIVNNNSTDNTEEVISFFTIKYKNVSTINEPKQGVCFARNTGYENVTTKWIVYLDDDAKAPRTFIKTALTIANSTKYDCFGGVYYPWYKYRKPVWFKDIYVSTAECYNKIVGYKLRYASAGIMAIKRSILKELNGFSINLGPKGNKMSYGEETHLQNRMLKKGYSIGITPIWHIHHLVNKNKFKFSWFLKNGYAVGRDYWIIYNEKVTIKLLLRYSNNILIALFKNTALLFKKNYYIQNWIAEMSRTTSLELGRIISGIKLLMKY